MPDLLLRDLPESMRAQIRKAAAASGRSLSEEAKSLIQKGLSIAQGGGGAGLSAWDELRTSFAGAELGDADHAGWLEAAEAARKIPVRGSPHVE